MSLLFVIARRARHLSPLIAAALLLACGSEPAPVLPGAPRSDSGIESGEAGVLEGAAEPPAGAVPAHLALHGRGLWVLAEGSQRVLEDPDRIAPLIESALALGASDLFVQVYRGGRAWYDASLADAGPYRAQLERSGVDTLELLLDRAHRSSLRVHAWVNVLSLSQNQEAPILAELGRQAVLVDNRGRSLLDYPGLEVPSPDRSWYRMGTRGVYLDAGAPGVAGRLVATFRELIARYPGLDGLHLDYIRHPGALPFAPGSRFGVGLDFGYGATSQERFRRETGLSGPFADPAQPDPARLVNANRWDEWRREKVTELVAGIRRETLAVRPGLVISAAVNSYVDRAYLTLNQDWKRWLEEGLLDLAVPMVYTLDDRLLRYQVAAFASGPDGERIWTGLGSWLFADQPERALRQIEIAREAGVAGDALFSYDSIAESPELLRALSADAAARRQP